jgi:Acetoacetate decarboxylase (ADC)
MPEYGRLGQDTLAHTSPALAPLYPAPPWPLKNARVLKIAYETDAAPVIEWLPPRLSRSAPPYAIITVARYPESPVGPFSLAAQYIGCRAGMFVRAFTLQALTDNTTALAALREVWGYPCTLGNIEMSEDGLSATVRSDDGAALAEASIADAKSIDPEALRFDPVLNVRAVPSLEEGRTHDLLQLLQIDPEHEIGESLRGSGSLKLDGWNVLPVRNIISSVSCNLNTELPLARFVMPY